MGKSSNERKQQVLGNCAFDMIDNVQIVLSKQGLRLDLYSSEDEIVAGPCHKGKLQLRFPLKNGNS
jgi:hypothetical protein